MANLPESASFDAGIYQIETTDAVIGGVNGISNLQAKALANRTTWLKQQVDALNALKGKGIAAHSTGSSYAGGDQVIYQNNIWQANTAITPGAFNPVNWTRQLGNAAEVNISTTAPAALGSAAVGASTTLARSDHVHAMPTLDALANTLITSNANGEILRWNGTNWINNTLAEAGIAPILSPTFTGTPSAPTAAAGTNTTQLATTAFVAALGALKANLESPTFTGNPAAPTPAQFDNDTSLANTQFVQSALGNYSKTVTINVSSYNVIAADAGAFFDVFSPASSIVLPATGGIPEGACYTFFVSTPVTFTSSTTIINGPGGPVAASVSVVSGTTVEVTCKAGLWFITKLGAGLASFTGNGWQRLTSGLIIQWGSGTISSTANAWFAKTITLPITYPNEHLYFVGNLANNFGQQKPISFLSRPVTTSSGTVQVFYDQVGGPQVFHFFSVGY